MSFITLPFPHGERKEKKEKKERKKERKKEKNNLRLDCAEIKPVVLFNKSLWHIKHSKHVLTNSYK
jgi:hypothetical protein